LDIYHIWCNLREGVSDLAFTDAVGAYLADLEQQGALIAHRVTRRKLGLGPVTLGEFHIMLEFADLAQLDQAFLRVATRLDPVESLHRAVYAKVKDLSFALYRDFPDAVRTRGGDPGPTSETP
jgi:Family of unknown function (DUF6614)